MTTGMNPSWVLSDEQRKKRFKKYRSDLNYSILKYALRISGKKHI